MEHLNFLPFIADWYKYFTTDTHVNDKFINLLVNISPTRYLYISSLPYMSKLTFSGYLVSM